MPVKTSSKRTRADLPFREKTELFLLYGDGSVVAQDHGRYVMMPGGGLEAGEAPAVAGKREAVEEAGAVVDGSLTHLVTVDFVWFPAWASNSKRKERYAKYQGERIHIMVGTCKELAPLNTKEEDSWKGRRSMSISKCAKLIETYGEEDHKNTYAYRIAQLSALKVLDMMSKAKK